MPVAEFIEFSNAQGTKFRYYYPDIGRTRKPAKWVYFFDPQKGEWVPFRKATNEDIREINKAVVESYHKRSYQ